jgi:hypothetical protein
MNCRMISCSVRGVAIDLSTAVVRITAAGYSIQMILDVLVHIRVPVLMESNRS